MKEIIQINTMQLPSKEQIAAFREGCYSHKKPEDCHLLAGYFRFKDHLHKAVKLYQINCDDYGYADSCLEYGTIAFTGIKEKSVTSDPVEALKYFEKGCKLGSSENCLNSGMLLVSPILKDSALERDLPKGMEYLKKSCDMNNGNACFYLSGMYMSGADSSLKHSSNEKSDAEKPKDVEKPRNSFILQKDMKKAFALTTKACELDNFFACANLSRMYAMGDGTKKNTEKSELYKKKSEELREDFNRKRILAQFQHP